MPERLLDGRYRLVDRIGAGGMGEVWRAHDEHLRREVAVKLVTGLGHDHDPTIAARFVREARAVARLSSPHIVTVYELGTAAAEGGPEVPYLVMELLDGQRLDRVVHGGDTLPALDDVARWGAQMCRALDTAHTAGVVHRDMKPANVLVTGTDPADDEDRLVKVLDFGIARLLDASGAPTALTATGSVVGTPAYMSPEQARGDVPVDERTDLYSLGCILYESVTGRLPFEAPVWHVMLRKHMDEPPVPPSRHRAELPRGWDELILSLLAKDPAGRPRAAKEVRKRLGELEGRTAAAARPVPAPAEPPPTPPPAPSVPPVDVHADTRTAQSPSRPTPTWVEPTPVRVQPAVASAPVRAEPAVASASVRVEPVRRPAPARREPAGRPAPARAQAVTRSAPTTSAANNPAPTGRGGAVGPLPAWGPLLVAVVCVGALFVLPWWLAVPVLVVAPVLWFVAQRRRGRIYKGKHQ